MVLERLHIRNLRYICRSIFTIGYSIAFTLRDEYYGRKIYKPDPLMIQESLENG